MAMEITNNYSNYATSSTNTTKNAGSTKESNVTTSKTGTEEQTRRTAKDELSYLTEKYECMKSSDYSVNINSSLLAIATSDEKTSKWLEYNLSLIPNVVDSVKSAAAARGAKLISCNITMNGYDSMTTEVVTQEEVDPGTEKAREELEEKIKERREEKKAQEEKAAERREKKKAEEEKAAEKQAEKKTAEETGNETGEYTISVTGTDIKAVAEKVIAASSGTSAPIGASFDIKA
ncbi:MAG: hypothetical protein HDR01_06530 [Lachnospiraceae bacterium]|nr:hypothetical protein [Lachnospiraceae bacterium]